MDSPPPTTLPDAVGTLPLDLDLGDARRDRRFRRVAQAIADNPGPSLPELSLKPGISAG